MLQYPKNELEGIQRNKSTSYAPNQAATNENHSLSIYCNPSMKTTTAITATDGPGSEKGEGALLSPSDQTESFLYGHRLPFCDQEAGGCVRKALGRLLVLANP